MKILVLCYEYPPVGGGGGRVAEKVAEELALRGHEVRVQTAGMRHLPKQETRNGVEIFRAESFRKKEDTCSVPEMALYLATSFLPALRLAQEWRPDIIHVHFAVPTGVLAFAVHLLAGTPYVLTAHLGDVPGGVPEQTGHLFRLVDPLVKPIWRKAKKLTAVSTHVASLARAAYGVECQVILNGIPAAQKPEITLSQPPRILFIGRLSIQKNPLLAVRALAALRDLPWSMEVIGEGPLGREMREEVSRLKLAERITFSGWLAGVEVARRMASADLLLMTSLHEGLPMVAVEALQHGLAIVGSAIGGMRDVVDGGANGFLCPLAEEAFANRLRQLLADRQLLEKMRKASRDKAAAFDLAHSVSAYEQVLLDAGSRSA